MAGSDADFLAKVESELKFHMDEAKVPQDVQLLVYKCGYDSMRIFAGLDDTKEAVRAALKDELPLDYTASPEKRRNMALLLSVWDTCRLQLSVQEKHKSEAKLGTHTRLIQTTEHASLRSAVESAHGDLCDKEVPSKSLIAQKLEQVEDNCPELEDLREVTSVADAATEAYAAVIDPTSNTLRFKPGKSMTTPPATPEELRLRHRRLGLAWEMARSRRSSRPWLPERCVDVFRKFSDRILGSKIAGLKTPDGRAAPWSTVLLYEAEVRRHAYDAVRKGEAKDLAVALREACKAPDVLSTYFIVPLTMMAAVPAAIPFREASPFKTKGKGKGKGSGKGGVVKAHLKKVQNPQGKKICFAYNRKRGCKRPDCQFAHICQRCFEAHSAMDCPRSQSEE